MFVAPGMAALLFYQHPQWLGMNTTNKGDFVKPTVHIQALVQIETVGDPKWHLLLWNAGDCDEHCFNVLEKLSRIRIALGRHYYEVNQALMLDESVNPMSPHSMNLLKKSETRMLHISQKELDLLRVTPHHQRIFIADPQGFVVLSYAQTADSEDVYHDIKRLLTKEL